MCEMLSRPLRCNLKRQQHRENVVCRKKDLKLGNVRGSSDTAKCCAFQLCIAHVEDEPFDRKRQKRANYSKLD